MTLFAPKLDESLLQHQALTSLWHVQCRGLILEREERLAGI